MTSLYMSVLGVNDFLKQFLSPLVMYFTLHHGYSRSDCISSWSPCGRLNEPRSLSLSPFLQLSIPLLKSPMPSGIVVCFFPHSPPCSYQQCSLFCSHLAVRLVFCWGASKDLQTSPGTLSHFLKHKGKSICKVLSGAVSIVLKKHA